MATVADMTSKKLQEVALPLVSSLGPPTPSREFLREMLQHKDGQTLAEFVERGRRYGEATYTAQDAQKISLLAAAFVDHHPEGQRNLLAGAGIASVVPGVNLIASPATNLLGSRAAEDNFRKGTELYSASLKATLHDVGSVFAALTAAVPPAPPSSITRIAPESVQMRLNSLVIPELLKLDDDSVGKRFMLGLYRKDEGRSLSTFLARAVDEKQLLFTADELLQLKDISLAVNPYQPDWHKTAADAAMVGSLVSLPLVVIPGLNVIGGPLLVASGAINAGVSLHGAHQGAERGADDVAKDVAAGIKEMDSALTALTRIFAGQALKLEMRPTTVLAAQEERAAGERPLLDTVREGVQQAVDAAKNLGK